MIPQLQRESEVAPSVSLPDWSLATRIGFRFFFSYFVLYLGPGAIGSLNAHGTMMNTPYRSLSNAVWHGVVPWVGTNLLHIPGDYHELANGSGDQLYDWVLVLCIAALALVITGVWSWLDRKRRNYEKLNAWLRVLVRLAIAGPMIGYGMAKMIRVQFPEPGLVKLIMPLGQQTPMDLLWTFMGSSHLYSFFGGVGELLAGILLIFPQFALLGTLVMLGVMANVTMLNLSYDVPRKIFCIHLMVFGLFLLLPDLRRLANLLVFNRAVAAPRHVPLFKDKRWNSYAFLLQVIFGVAAVFSAISVCRGDYAVNAAHVGPAYRGIWQVEEFVADGVPHPPLLTDSQRWRYVVLDGASMINLQMMDSRVEQYGLRLDEQHKTMRFAEADATRWKGDLSIDSLQSDEMRVSGRLDGHPVSARLRRLNLSDREKFPLINRGLRWVTQIMNSW